MNPIRRWILAWTVVAFGAGFAVRAPAGAVYDSDTNTVYVQGPHNTLKTIAEDLFFPPYFSYDFVTCTAVCDANIHIEVGGVLTLGDRDTPSREETLRFTGPEDSQRVLMAAGEAFLCYHSQVTAAPERAHCYTIRHQSGKMVIEDSVIRNARHGVSISGRPGSRHDLTVRDSTFEGCRTPLLLCSLPAELRNLTFRSCGSLAVHRGPIVLTDCTFEDCPHPYSNVGQWRYGENSRLVLVNCTPWKDFPDDRKMFYRSSNAVRKWYLRVQVLDAQHEPIAGARARVRDNAGNVEVQGSTGPDGFVRSDGSGNLPVTDFTRDAQGTHDADPHRVEVEWNGREHAESVTMDDGAKDQPVEKAIVLP